MWIKGYQIMVVDINLYAQLVGSCYRIRLERLKWGQYYR